MFLVTIQNLHYIIVKVKVEGNQSVILLYYHTPRQQLSKTFPFFSMDPYLPPPEASREDTSSILDVSIFNCPQTSGMHCKNERDLLFPIIF
mgnify:CR=1 FL=1